MDHTPKRASGASHPARLTFGVLGLGLGLIFIVVGWSSASGERSLSRDGVVVQGSVAEKRIDHVTRRKTYGGTSEETLYVVRYRFTTRLGAALDGDQEVSEAFWRSLKQDGPIAVRYLEADPFVNRADAEQRADTNRLLVGGGLLAFAGSLLLIVGVAQKRRALQPPGR